MLERKRARHRTQVKDVRHTAWRKVGEDTGPYVCWTLRRDEPMPDDGDAAPVALDWQYMGIVDGCSPEHQVLRACGERMEAGDVQAGTRVKGPGSSVVVVEAVEVRTGRRLRLESAQGDALVLGADQRLDLYQSKHGQNKVDEIEVTLEEYLKWPRKRQRDYRLRRTAVDFPQGDAEDGKLPIDPWLMGALTAHGAGIEGEAGIVLPVQKNLAGRIGEALDREPERQPGRAGLAIVKLRPEERESLKAAGWKAPYIGRDEWGNPTLEAGTERPGLPTGYRTASRAARRAALAGALDAKHIAYGGRRSSGAWIQTGSGAARDDMKWIARTLGMSAHDERMGEQEGIGVVGDFTVLPSRTLDTGALEAISTKNDWHLYSEMEVERIDEVSEFAGITLAGDGRFLLEDTTITHNTTRIVIPGILATDDACMVVNDPKPELWPIVSGWRSDRGQAYRLDWGKEDEPEKGVFHPKFNFIAEALVPPKGGKRDNFVDALAKVLIPAKEGGGDNTYFVNQGRAALIGFTQYLLHAINDRKTDAERYDELPERWHGKQASFPMLVDWLVETELKASETEEGEEEAEDPMRDYLKGVVKKAKRNRFPQPCIVNLQPLVNMADKERSGVMGSMQEALMSFRNTSVVERTEDTDFLPQDLGGRIKEDVLQGRLGYEPGTYPQSKEDWDEVIPRITDEDWEPVDVFVCVNQAEAQAFEVLTALFLDVVVRFLISYGPGERTANGALMGPYPTCFMMDELVKMARCDAVVDGPDLGRSKKRFFVLIAQAMAQIERRYSKQQRDTIMTSCAATVALPQNDPATIEEIAKKSGDTTVKRESVSFQRNAKPWSGNVSTNLEKVRLLHTGNIGRMPKGEHVLIVQDWNARPVQCKSCMYFLEPEMLKKAWNPREKNPAKNGPPEAKPLPPGVHKRRLDEWNRKREQEQAAEEEAKRNEAFEAWRYAVDLERMVDTPAAGP